MTELFETDDKEIERAILVGVWVRGQNEEWEARDTLEELAQLTAGAGADIRSQILCKQSKIHAGHYIGKGKVEDIARRVQEEEANLVVFDEDLTPAQGRNLENAIGVRVVDRTQLILDIFAQRARTREGCLQVELAQHHYLLPRLRNMWTHLERQKGGIGMKGPGETQVEMDRRRIQELIITLSRELNQVRVRRAEQRRGRRRHGWALVSLVGYTNAGKSTLLNKLAGSDIYAQDQLFATLDPTTRQVELPNRELCLITDTVGFIRKLPHNLVESFKATLEEVTEADLVVHVIDCSHPQVEQQIDAVNVVLQEIGAEEKPMLCVLNKIDSEEGAGTAKRLARTLGRSIAVSALTGENVDGLLDELSDCLKGDKVLMNLSIPLAEGRLLALLQSSATVLEEKYEGPNAEIVVRVPLPLVPRCEPYKMDI
ncbi:MAG: GTPase HflX [Kiritimatiellaceae bacterium]|nr:GTPase HflX [Kiritimatiellaceae bacterium]